MTLRVRLLLFVLLLLPSFAWGQALSRREAALLNPLEYGSSCTTATLQGAISAAPATGRVLMLTPVQRDGTPCVWAITSNVTVPSTLVLHVPQGASVAISSGVTLTLARYPREDNRAWKTGTGTLVITEANPATGKLNVKDFGAVGNGVADDRTAIQAALNATLTAGTKHVYFPTGTYYLGAFNAYTRILDLSALGTGVTLETEKDVLLTTDTTAPSAPAFFYVENNSHLHVGPIRFQDFGYVGTGALHGAIGFQLINAGGNWGDIVFESIDAFEMVSAVQVSNNTLFPVDAVNRIRGIHIKQLFANHTFYGFTAANEGDGVTIDNLVAHDILRPYFVYGVSGHKVKIFNRNNRNSTGQVLIGRGPASDGGPGGLNTHGIEVSYTARDMVGPQGPHVLIYHLDLLGGEISGITVDVNIHGTDGTAYYPVKIVNYTASGGVETTAASTNIVRDIRLSGTCDGFALPPAVVASYAAKYQMHFITGFNFLPEQSLYDKFQLTQSSRAQTNITWSASGASPTLGDGTLTHDIDIFHGMLQISINLTLGSTTSAGTGEWSFSGYGFVSKAQAQGTCLAIDSGGNYWTGVARIFGGDSSTIRCFFNNLPTAAGVAVPFGWSTGDSLHITITFPLS